VSGDASAARALDASEAFLVLHDALRQRATKCEVELLPVDSERAERLGAVEHVPRSCQLGVQRHARPRRRRLFGVEEPETLEDGHGQPIDGDARAAASAAFSPLENAYG